MGSRCGVVNPGIPDGNGGFTVATARGGGAPIPVTPTPYGPYCANPQFVQSSPGQGGAGCLLTIGALDPARPNPNPDCSTITPQDASPFRFCFDLAGG